MICPNCGHYTNDQNRPTITEARIEELWAQSGWHMLRFIKLLLAEINQHE